MRTMPPFLRSAMAGASCRTSFIGVGTLSAVIRSDSPICRPRKLQTRLSGPGLEHSRPDSAVRGATGYPLDGVRRREIQRERGHLDGVLFAQLHGERLERRALAGDEQQLDAARGQAMRESCPESLGAPGDQCPG